MTVLGLCWDYAGARARTGAEADWGLQSECCARLMRFRTYDDDASIGKPAPAIDAAEYVKGDPITLGGGKVGFCLHSTG